MQKIIPIKPIDQQRVNPKCKEIYIELFTDCNIRCDFCCLADKATEFSKTHILQQLDAFNTIIDKLETKQLTLHVMGGEMFMDKLPRDEMIASYDEFFAKLYAKLKQCGISSKLNISTNLLHHNVDIALYLSRKYGFSINASFDLSGRFSKTKQLKLFLENLSMIANSTDQFTIGVVLHRQNYLAIKDKSKLETKIFDNLYERYANKINFEYFDEVNQAPQFNIFNEELIDFLILLTRRYPKLPISHSLIAQANKVSTTDEYCLSYTRIVNGKIFSNCDASIMLHELKKQFIMRNNCLMCEYYKFCGLTCYRIFKNKTCVLKPVCDYIKNDTNLSGRA